MENIVNYQRVLDRTLQELEGKTPRLLLHACCAPCSTYCLEYLAPRFDITLYYYNPNTAPLEEYQHRLREVERLLEQMPLPRPVRLMEGPYDPESFYAAARGLEGEPEGGARCRACFALRLRQSARVAREQVADYFTTTLSIGPLKNSQILNELGKKIGEEEGVPYLLSDFKKRGGYQRSLVLSKQYGLYRQNYCGCLFSRRPCPLQ